MDQSTGLLSGLCGLGIVCSGLLLVGALVVIRLSGRGLLPLLSLVLNRRNDDKPVSIPQLRRRPRVDLRARARSVDFDAALAAASQDNAPPATPGPRRPVTPDFRAAPASDPWVTENGRRPGSEDEIFGGMMDADDEWDHREGDGF